MTTNADLNRVAERVTEFIGDQIEAAELNLSDAEILLDKIEYRMDEVRMPPETHEPDEDWALDRHRTYSPTHIYGERP